MDQQLKVRLSREQKKELKYQRVKERQKVVRKKIQKTLKDKLKKLNPEQKQQYFQIKCAGEEKQKEAFEKGISVILDLEYDVIMSDREIRSLSLQISHIVGINKELQNPVQLHLTNVNGLQKAELEKQGYSKWLIHQYETDLQELINSNKFNREFIYLSPDADEYLDDVDPTKYVYVVGGFVDRQVQKYMSYNKAQALQICAKKLPIDEYIKGNKRPLNIDNVVAILSLYYTHKDWKTAYDKAGGFNKKIMQGTFLSHINSIKFIPLK
ncbi:hypothetical protein pb186bvf_005429 [Paramecium bursaria]